MNRALWFAVVNAAFLLLIIGAATLGSANGVHPLYLILLFALCTSPLLSLSRLNDRYALLALFSLIFFQFYGILDLLNLLMGTTLRNATKVPISAPEFVILAGGAAVHLGYRIACGRNPRSITGAPLDWAPQSLIIVGLTVFVVCTSINWVNRVDLFFNKDSLTDERVQASLSNIELTALMLGALLQPLGLLILAYAQCISRRTVLTIILVAAVLVQAVYGFVTDVKSDVLLGGILVLLTRLLMTGRIPRASLIAFVMFLTLAWPVLQAHRAVESSHASVNNAEVARNLGTAIAEAFAARTAVNTGEDRAQKFYERASLKDSVELIVSNVGISVPYQYGFTLTPIPVAFIPKLIWPTKPAVPTGRILNKEFQVTDDADTYISPSHLGEMYWNFGWPGVIIGMTLFGLLIGYLGATFDLSTSVTLTRLLVLVVTIRLLILGAEGSMAAQYVTWLRSMAAIGVMHFLLANQRARPIAGRDSEDESLMVAASTSSAQCPYPNIMR